MSLLESGAGGDGDDMSQRSGKKRQTLGQTVKQDQWNDVMLAARAT
jgi:hypothetical protein